VTRASPTAILAITELDLTPKTQILACVHSNRKFKLIAPGDSL
jgi:hypothetical protein